MFETNAPPKARDRGGIDESDGYADVSQKTSMDTFENTLSTAYDRRSFAVRRASSYANQNEIHRRLLFHVYLSTRGHGVYRVMRVCSYPQ